MVEIKFCGLTRSQDARAAEEAGAAFGGVILTPGGPRFVAPEIAEAILGGTALRRCGVFVDETYDMLARRTEELGLDVLQLHGDESPILSARLRAATGREVWKAIRPRSGEEFLTQLDRFAGSVDGMLLDGWSAAARGGTGTSFPWEEVAAFRGALPTGVRLIVAGGLRLDNVAAAIASLEPHVVDVSSGVEQAPGIKDEIKIRRFAEAVRRTTEATSHAGEGAHRHPREGRTSVD